MKLTLSKKSVTLIASLGFALGSLQAANVAVVGNGASSGPIITTSTFQDIALGTRVRIGKFNDTNQLATTINSFKSSALDYAGIVSWLNNTNNFVDLGTSVTNYGNSSQTGTGVSSTAFVYNTTATLTVNGVTAPRNVFNGSIANVNYSSSIGFSTPVFLWVANGSEVGIFRDSGWVTPTSDLTALTLNLNTISSAQTGNTEILLGGYQDYATGTDLLTLIPEPGIGSLVLLGIGFLLASRRSRLAKVFVIRTSLTMLAFGFPWILSAQTVSTPIVGFYKASFPAGGSLQTVALLKSVSFQGTSTAITGSTLSCTGANWTANAYAPVNSLPAYYLEITSGPLQGYVFDIVSNTSSSLTVSSVISGFGSSAPSFLVRAHTKLSEALSSATNLQDYNDQVTIYNSDATSQSFLRDSSTTTGWVDAITFAESDAVIYPGQGYVLSTGAAGNITISGSVKNTPTAVPLYPGAVNIVTTANPGGTSKNVQSIGLGSGLVDYSDQLATYTSDGSLTVQDALLYGGSVDGWLDAITFSTAANVNVNGVVPIIVTVTTPSVWLIQPPLNQ